METRNICLDHDHRYGHVRAVLCRNCNGIEGKVFNLANRGKREGTPLSFLKRLIDYWEHWNPDNHDIERLVFHPDHKTEQEQKDSRNKKARVARARKQATKNLKR